MNKIGENMNNSNYELVCLEGIEEGNKFYTANHENPEKIRDGTVVCKILGYANTSKEAQSILFPNDTPEKRQQRLKDYMMKMPLKELGIDEVEIDYLSTLL